jgi:hypothetical protein
VRIQGKQRGECEYRGNREESGNTGEIEESENTGETEGRVGIQGNQMGE